MSTAMPEKTKIWVEIKSAVPDIKKYLVVVEVAIGELMCNKTEGRKRQTMLKRI